MPYRCAMWMTIDGDLRFLSHHDVMQTMERLVIRAGLPLRYTQGFNPHPVLSLVYPRPVGVVSLCDLFVFTLNEHVETDKLLQIANLHAPSGMNFIRAQELEGSRTPQPVECFYGLIVTEELRHNLDIRLEQWAKLENCPYERVKPGKTYRDKPRSRTIDLKELVSDLRCENGKLLWRQISHNSLWAKPSEVLDWLGLPTEYVSQVIRTHVNYEGV